MRVLSFKLDDSKFERCIFRNPHSDIRNRNALPAPSFVYHTT